MGARNRVVAGQAACLYSLVRPVGAGNSAVVVDLPRWGPMLSPRVPNLVPILGPRMERETPGQRPRPNYGHPHGAGKARGWPGSARATEAATRATTRPRAAAGGLDPLDPQLPQPQKGQIDSRRSSSRMAPPKATVPIAMAAAPRRLLIQRRLSPIALLLSPTVIVVWSPTTTRRSATLVTADFSLLSLMVTAAGSDRSSSDVRSITFDLTAVMIPAYVDPGQLR